MLGDCHVRIVDRPDARIDFGGKRPGNADVAGQQPVPPPAETASDNVNGPLLRALVAERLPPNTFTCFENSEFIAMVVLFRASWLNNVIDIRLRAIEENPDTAIVTTRIAEGVAVI